MMLPLQITTHDVPCTDFLKQYIQGRFDKLQQFCSSLVSCRVDIDMPHMHKYSGRLINVSVSMLVPEGTMTVNRHASDDVYAAVRDAFEAASDRLEDRLRQKESLGKSNDDLMQGRVGRIFEYDGYGFIETQDGREYFFSRDSVTDSGGFSKIKRGTEVQFLDGAGVDGFQARRVSSSTVHAM